MTKLMNEFNEKFDTTDNAGDLSPDLRSTGNIYINIDHQSSEQILDVFDKDETKEIRDYMIELKSLYEMYQHSDQKIKKLEKEQNTICPSFLDQETFEAMKLFFSRFELLYQ